MRAGLVAAVIVAGGADALSAQENYYPEAYGPASMGAQEQLYPFDDQEPWKHGYRQVMPYYGGWHSFRPYNYHHVFGQTRTTQSFGLSMPYSQQFWHRYQAVPGGDVAPLYQPQVAPLYQPQPVWTPPASPIVAAPASGVIELPWTPSPAPAAAPNSVPLPAPLTLPAPAY
ncbi:MAG: hypothetical protein KF774_12335 [Planctomyces sp.]|nr:hypothetical protein [Planctomyces sp.]